MSRIGRKPLEIPKGVQVSITKDAVSVKGPKGTLRLELRYEGRPSARPGSGNAITGMRRVSRPGQRHYVPAKDIPKVRNGLGIAILSTSQGVMTDKEARTKGVGGEVLCEVW